MKISVIVPCYNIEAYVGRCVRSVLAQTWSDLEVLLVDDGSEDGTGAVCDALAKGDARIRVIHQENAGPGAARNTGIGQARGEWLAFADGDDAMLPDMLTTLADAAMETGADIAACPYLTVGAREALQESEDRKMAAGQNAAPQELPHRRVLTQGEALEALVSEREELVIQNAAWNKLYRREVFDGIRYPDGRYEDILTSARLIAAARAVCYVDRPLYRYTLDRGTSIMNGSARQSILTEQIPAYHARDAFLSSIGRKDLALVNDYMAGKKLLILYTEGKWKAGDREFARALEKEIDRWFRPQFEAVYGCPVADRHHAMRMRLFLIHPMLYDAFTALNEKVVLPLRRRFGGRVENPRVM